MIGSAQKIQTNGMLLPKYAKNCSLLLKWSSFDVSPYVEKKFLSIIVFKH